MVWVDKAKILATLGVVVTHVSASTLFGLRDPHSLNWWAANCYDPLARFAVPFFVMISGGLLLDPAKEEPWGVFYKKRARRILPPLVFWTLFFTGWTVFLERLGGTPVSAWLLIERTAAGRPYYHLWYLYMIPFLYLFVPFLRRALPVLKEGEMRLLCALSFLTASAGYGYNYYVCGGRSPFIAWFVFYLPYFFAGYFFVHRRTGAVRRKTSAAMYLLCAGLTALGCYVLTVRYNLKTGLFFYTNLSPTVILLSVSLFAGLKKSDASLPPSRRVRDLAGLSLGIYLIHPLYIDLLKYFGWESKHFLPWISIPLLSVIVFLFSGLTALVISRLPFLRRVVV